MADPDFIHSQLLSAYGVTGVFSLRGGGVSPPPFDTLNFGLAAGDADDNISSNLHRLITAVGLPSIPHQAVQMHKTDLLWCSGAGHAHQQQADILITDQPDTALAVRVADCLPILLADPETGIVAAVHAGWRGAAAAIAARAVQAMIGRGAKQTSLLAWLGPCIGPCCFAIGSDTAKALQASAKAAKDCISYAAGIHADLPEINRLQLLAAGLDGNHIEVHRACTACNPGRFFSFRRDGERSGRHLAIVAAPPGT